MEDVLTEAQLCVTNEIQAFVQEFDRNINKASDIWTALVVDLSAWAFKGEDPLTTAHYRGVVSIVDKIRKSIATWDSIESCVNSYVGTTLLIKNAFRGTVRDDFEFKDVAELYATLDQKATEYIKSNRDSLNSVSESTKERWISLQNDDWFVLLKKISELLSGRNVTDSVLVIPEYEEFEKSDSEVISYWTNAKRISATFADEPDENECFKESEDEGTPSPNGSTADNNGDLPERAVSFADDIESLTVARVSDEIPEFDPPEGEPKAKKSKVVDEDGIPEKKKQHTLDSDEEDNDEDEDKLDIKKVEGQEDCEVDFDGNTKITAFNMKEDMEEGHFDADGNFVYDKKEKGIKDAWLDDIDWASIKRKAGDQWEVDQEADDIAPPALTDGRRREIFVELIAALQPGQTVAKALADIKKKKGLSAAEERKLRWAAKKAGTTVEDTDGQKDAKVLSGLADELLTAGHMEAYEWPRERIEMLLSKLDSVAVDALDMFGDEPMESAEPAPSTSTPAADVADEDDVKWEYKDSEDAAVQGPFTSAEMAAKQDKGDLAPKGLARKNGSGSFNPVARIDFDLFC